MTKSERQRVTVVDLMAAFADSSDGNPGIRLDLSELTAKNTVISIVLVEPVVVESLAFQLGSAPERWQRYLGAAERDEAWLAPSRLGERGVCRILLRMLLCRWLGRHIGSQDFVLIGKGKPTLAGIDSQFDFNVSHSGGYLALVFSAAGPVGIDVETRNHQLKKADRLAKQFFSESEGFAFFALPPEERPKVFRHIWAAKEAYVKSMGSGIFAETASSGFVLEGRTFRRVDGGSAAASATKAKVLLLNDDPSLVLCAVSTADKIKLYAVGK